LSQGYKDCRGRGLMKERVSLHRCSLLWIILWAISPIIFLTIFSGECGFTSFAPGCRESSI
jgi:hypothetical protein